MDRLEIARPAWEEAIAHLRTCLPDEGVGFFLGNDGLSADRFIPARNAGLGRRFVVDPFDQFHTFRVARTEQKRVVALCHSHPWGGTTLSDDDLRNAREWDFLQVVVALSSPEAGARAAAWRCHGGAAFPVRVVVPDVASPVRGKL
jgi:proteasome lid subunit RPN8/RPN11